MNNFVKRKIAINTIVIPGYITPFKCKYTTNNNIVNTIPNYNLLTYTPIVYENNIKNNIFININLE